MRLHLVTGLTPFVLTVAVSCVSDDNVNPPLDGGNDGSIADSDAPAAPFSLSATPNPILVPRTGTANLTVAVTRNTGFTGDVQIGVTNLPTGVTSTTQTAASGATQVVLTLTGAAATSGSVTATVTGTSTGTSAGTTTVIVEVPGAPGTPDTSFGTAGIFTGDTTIAANYNMAVVIQPDGKIVIASTLYNATKGYISVVRLLTNGTLDTSFNTTGENATILGEVGGVALQSDGKIVVGGTQGMNMIAARYTTDGVADTSFNSVGYNTYAHSGGNGDNGMAVGVLPNGEIVVAGTSSQDVDPMVVSAFTTTGAVDGTYSNKATYYCPNNSDTCYSTAVTMQPSFANYLIVGGLTDVGNGAYAEFIRFDPTGTPTTFNGGPTGLTMAGTSYGVNALLTLQNQGMRALSESTQGNTSTYNRIDGISASGALDTTFNTTGTFSFPAPSGGEPVAMAEGLDNNLIVVGTTTTPTGYVSRVLSNGTGLDANFGTAGSVANVFGTGAGASDAAAVAIDAGGNIIVVGRGKVVSGSSAAGTLYVTRLWP